MAFFGRRGQLRCLALLVVALLLLGGEDFKDVMQEFLFFVVGGGLLHLQDVSLDYLFNPAGGGAA